MSLKMQDRVLYIHLREQTTKRRMKAVTTHLQTLLTLGLVGKGSNKTTILTSTTEQPLFRNQNQIQSSMSDDRLKVGGSLQTVDMIISSTI